MRTLPVTGLLEGAADEVRFCPGSTETERGGGPPVFSGVGPWLGEAMTKNDSEHNTRLETDVLFFCAGPLFPPPPTEADYNPAAARARVRTYVCMYGDAANRCQLPALMRRNPYESKTLRFHLLQAHYTFASIILCIQSTVTSARLFETRGQ